MSEDGGQAAGATAMRTDLCGQLGPDDVGRAVRLCGWVARRREHGEHLAFVDLRDHTGIVQCVVDGSVDVRSEYVVAVDGVVRRRPEGMENPQLATGQVEIGDCRVDVLASAEPPPFAVEDRVEVDEAVRLRNRYVDLRRPRMQANLRLRAVVNAAIRRAFERQGFCEVETPLLWAPTPEGAREFAVPSRLHPGAFYVLPQSPQLAKQLLMVGGLDRYYQIARCLRDEDLRADRQFEFTQLDMEASFVSQTDVLGFVSEAVLDATEAATGARPPEIERMTWAEAIDRYGTDKPDLRFGMELLDLSATFAGTGVRAFAAPCVKALRLEAGGSLGRAKLDGLVDRAKALGAKGLAWFRVVDGEGGTGPALDSPLDRFLSAERAGRAALDHRGPAGGPGAGGGRRAPAGLHRARAAAGGAGRAAGGGRTAPLRVGGGVPHVRRGGRRRATRWPPTTPSPCPTPTTWACWPPIRRRCAPRPTTWCSTAGSWARAACGSTGPTSSPRSSQHLGISEEEAASRFGFLLGAFRYGAPPHAGFAFGIDRLVAIFAGEENIREVIAFPKTQSGSDPLTGAPKPLAPAALADLGIRPAGPPKGPPGSE